MDSEVLIWAYHEPAVLLESHVTPSRLDRAPGSTLPLQNRLGRGSVMSQRGVSEHLHRKR